MTRIEQRLRETAGFDAESVGPSAVQRAVRARMRTLGLKHPEAYEAILDTSPAERTELLELVVVTETWFFRDPDSFAALVRLAREDWLPANRDGILRVLSLPCASGEEPYSMAMAFRDAGVPLDRVQIDAVDISPRALECARCGVYRRNSFRGKELGFRDRYFQSTKEGYALEPAVCKAVRFSKGNLFSEGFLTGRPAYNVVFCRNLLIYFDRPTQRRALERLGNVLAPDGVLFVGPAELPLLLESGFVSARLPLAFACRKGGAAPVPGEAARRSTTLPASVAAADDPSSAAGVETQPARRPQAARSLSAGQAAPVALDLEQARRLADAGQLSEAAALCEAHLKQARGSAYAYYLLGLVRDAAGDAAAADYYRKALYLEPNHYESLLQMASLAERSGDSARAHALRRRAERAHVPG